mmetsp:Transcript_19192/g.57049  ORF Transcript_19192/g.57049 Transcript_19192/m.57049 type:complete len:233 (-) Transcript_19192:767-1465(-)
MASSSESSGSSGSGESARAVHLSLASGSGGSIPKSNSRGRSGSGVSPDGVAGETGVAKARVGDGGTSCLPSDPSDPGDPALAPLGTALCPSSVAAAATGGPPWYRRGDDSGVLAGGGGSAQPLPLPLRLGDRPPLLGSLRREKNLENLVFEVRGRAGGAGSSATAAAAGIASEAGSCDPPRVAIHCSWSRVAVDVTRWAGSFSMSAPSATRAPSDIESGKSIRPAEMRAYMR